MIISLPIPLDKATNTGLFKFIIIFFLKISSKHSYFLLTHEKASKSIHLAEKSSQSNFSRKFSSRKLNFKTPILKKNDLKMFKTGMYL